MLTTFSAANLPLSPGVYIFKDKDDKVLYIGKAKNIQKRVQQYFTPGSMWKQDMLARACKLEWIETSSEQDALLLEENMIKQYQPEYNRLLKHNTQYVYIRISGDDFPLLTITRQKKTSDQGASYIGPKRQSRLLHVFLDYIRNLYQLRTCKNSQFMRGKFCIQYDFNLCAGWCRRAPFLKRKVGKEAFSFLKKFPKQGKQAGGSGDEGGEAIGEGDIENAKREYQNALFSIRRFFEGDTSFVCQDILFRIEQAIKTENFERAAKLRDMYRAIAEWTQEQQVLLTIPLTGIVCAIKPIASWYVICLLKLFDGKIVDIVRTKEWMHEVDVSTLVANLKSEFFAFRDIRKLDCAQRNITLFYDIGKDEFSSEDAEKIVAFLEQSIDSFLASDVMHDASCSVMNELLHTLQERYKLSKFPYRIECVDISHFSGDYVSGGISCFVGGVPYYKGYRRYHVTGKAREEFAHKVGLGNQRIQGRNFKEHTHDDYANICEVIIRRFGLNEIVDGEEKDAKESFLVDFLPDIFIIDGGSTHLELVRKIFFSHPKTKAILSHTCFIALGKGKARKRAHIGQDGVSETIYYFDQKFAIRQKKLVYDEADKIFIKARDEAHRFANAYREKQASKQWKV